MNLPSVDPVTLGAAGLTVLATLATAIKLVWTWMTNLIDRFQVEATNSRKEFLAEVKSARVDFLSGLQKIEDRRVETEAKIMDGQDRIHETLVGLHEVIRERGVPSPQGKVA